MGLKPYKKQSKSYTLGTQLWGIGVAYEDITEWLTHPVIIEQSKDYNLPEIEEGWRDMDQCYEDYCLNSVCEHNEGGEFTPVNLENL